MRSLAPFYEVAIVAAFQHLGQIYDQYRRHSGDAVLRSFKTMVLMPGLDQKTTEFAARLAGFNAVQHAEKIDVRTKKREGDRLAEAKRVEVYEEVLHELGRRKWAIALVGDAPPIKFSPPPLVQACAEELSHTANKGTPYVIDFQTAEAQYEGVDTKGRTDSRSNPGQHAEWCQPQSSQADEIKEERTQRRPGDPTADGDSLEV